MSEVKCEHKNIEDGEFYLWCKDCGALNAECGGKNNWQYPTRPVAQVELDENEIDDIVFNAYKDLYEPFRKDIVKAICWKLKTCEKPKWPEKLSLVGLESIKDERIRMERKRFVNGFNEAIDRCKIAWQKAQLI